MPAEGQQLDRAVLRERAARRARRARRLLGAGFVIAVRHGDAGDPERTRRHLDRVDPGLLRYFRDINDHVRRIHEEVLAQREQLAGVLDAYLSLIGLRQSEIAAQQNRVVTQLTVMAAVFLALTFVTGFFGQSFGWLTPEVDSLAVFLAAGLGRLAVSCVAVLVWLRRGGLGPA